MNMDLKENYEELSAAVIGQACEDYVMALKYIKRYKQSDPVKYNKYIKEKNEIEDFFQNEMKLYSSSNIEPKLLIQQLKKIAKEKENSKYVRFLKNKTKTKE